MNAARRILATALALGLLAVGLAHGGASAATRSPSLAVGSAKVSEGNNGTRTLNFPVTLSFPASTAVSVAYTVVGSTSSTTNTDFKAKSGTLNFALGTNGLTPTMKNIAVPVYSDALVEGTETVSVILSNPSVGVMLANPVGIGTITDDDPNLIYGQRIDVGDAGISEADAGNTQSVDVNVTLSQAASTPITVNYTVKPGTATAGADYTATTTGTVTFPAGAVQRAVTVKVLPDSVDESDESLQVVLSAPTGALGIIGRSTGTVTIQSSEFRGLSSGPKVGVAGDSITYVAAGSIESALTSRYRVWLSGQPGFRIAQVQPAIKQQIAAGANAMVVNLGTNDVGNRTGTWLTDYNAMVASLLPVACVQLVTINEAVSNYYATLNNDLNGNGLVDSNEIVTVGTEINKAIRATVAANANFHLIDWNALVAPNSLVYTTDGIHPNAAGQAWLGSATRKALDTTCA